MKRILALLMTFVLIFTFVGCGDSSNDNGSSGSGGDTPPTQTPIVCDIKFAKTVDEKYQALEWYEGNEFEINTKIYVIVDFTLINYNAEDEYCDELAAQGKVLAISVYDPEMKPEKWERIAERIRHSEAAGFCTILIAASAPDTFAGFVEKLGEEDRKTIFDHLYFSDYKTLITLNRSNGGATYFSDGELICKWAFRAFPDEAQLEQISLDNDIEASIEKSTRKDIAFQGFLLYVTAVMLLL